MSPPTSSYVTPRTMSGVMELLPLEQVAFEGMIDVIRREFERFGYVPIATPAMELTEVLLRKTGGETERQVYLVQSTGSAEQGDDPDLALRFDLTVPLARYVAEHEHQLSFPFRRHQIQPVYRGERPQRGRYREFYQCDIDVIDRNELSLRFDAEIPAVINSVFAALDFGEFVIRLNSRRLLAGLMEKLEIEPHVAALRELDRLDRKGPENVIASLSKIGVTNDAAQRLVELAATGLRTGSEAFTLLDEIGGDNDLLKQGVGEMRDVLTLVREWGVPEHRFGLDLSIARGLDYYTGTVYETTLVAHPELGSICSGGRYDDLAGQYTKSRLPGVGISIGLSRLFWQLQNADLLPAAKSTVEVLVGLLDDAGLPEALRIAAELRDAGVNTESVLVPDRIGNQLKFAAKNGIDLYVVAGENERQSGEVLVRNLRTQTQASADRKEVVAAVQAQ
ncbi:MAG: histidine--tRNA ligase [Actinobacteria bacterium]|nr:histidine--tRNA ligase [Actinomycetota bacterium]